MRLTKEDASMNDNHGIFIFLKKNYTQITMFKFRELSGFVS